MRFGVLAALLAVVLVVAPLAAHLLKLRRPQARVFPPARLVPSAPPAARSRSRLEDPWLLAIRVIAVVALTLLGSTPFVRCSRLAIGRASGASVAMVIVVDDSASMRARTPSGRTRFEIARKGAMDLASGAREGDSIGLVLAGDPVRVALVPTSDTGAMATALEAMQVSDRATDLDGALATAQNMVRPLPQGDRRIVVLSDLADGRPDGPAIGEGMEVAVWAPREGLDAPVTNCAVLRADRGDRRVVARVACFGADAARERHVEVRAGGNRLASRPIGAMDPERASSMDVTVELPDNALQPEEAVLVGPADGIADDDRAPVAPPVRGAMIAVVSDAAGSRIATGGPPPVEQALAALDLGVTIRPLPAIPDTPEELAPYAGLVIDDPPGLTPEAREAVGKWLDGGGVALAALGPRAASAPLGATLEPFVRGNVRWEKGAPNGVDPKSASVLGPSAESLTTLRASGRTLIEPNGVAEGDAVIRWADGATWLSSKAVGRGTAMALTMSMAPEQSDLVVRPGFLALLSLMVETAASRGGARRIEIGSSWAFPKDAKVEVVALPGTVEVRDWQERKRVTPHVAGRYDMRVDGVAEVRFASLPEREVDQRVRKVAGAAASSEAGATSAWIDLSRYIALVLLALLAGEMVVRFVMTRRTASPSAT